MLAFHRQHHQEIATVRRISLLYTKAVEQLGSDKAPVRLGGLYALERFAQDNPAYRQTTVNVICAYLRTPFSPAAPASWPEPEAVKDQEEPGAEGKTGIGGVGGTWQQEKEVRLTAQRILGEHLRDDRAKDQQSADPPSSRLWNDIGLNLTGATLIDFNLVNGVTADANFRRAAFSGSASFSGATFSGAVQFGGAAFGGDALFGGAAFSRGAGFRKAVFSGDAGFHRAVFSGGAGFRNAVFSGDAWFGGVVFGGDAGFGEVVFRCDAWFDEATFNRGAWFDEAAFGGDAWFDEATFNRGVSFDEAAFGGDAWFDEATFGGGAWFDEAAFGRGAWFDEATFGGDAWFDEATFGRGADAVHFELARILSPGASHVWPTGWRLADADGGGYTVARAHDGGGS